MNDLSLKILKRKVRTLQRCSAR